MEMNARQLAAYHNILEQTVDDATETSRTLGAILLNSYNENLPGTDFRVGRFRNFDATNRGDVLIYLEWLGSAPGLYPPSDDMDNLKRIWAERGWFDKIR
ncbi:MAG: hypothetical protein DI547_16730 [Sphingobium sp.]|nr:MAG: hypothetical protein DI547_16730 [Sphingobium sp.]